MNEGDTVKIMILILEIKVADMNEFHNKGISTSKFQCFSISFSGTSLLVNRNAIILQLY